MGPRWGLNPVPSENQSDALTTELVKSLGRGAVGKLYIDMRDLKTRSGAPVCE